MRIGRTCGLLPGAGSLRIVVRTLARSRGFAVVAIVSLGLAIGLNTTIYSLLDALIDPVVGVRQPEELYRIRYFGDVHHHLPRGAIDSALSAGLRGYQGVTGYQPLVPLGRRATVERGDRATAVDPLLVRSNFFGVLGTHAVDGRVFAPSDEALDAPIAVISDRLAAELFPGADSPIGATLTIEGQGYTVIGTVRRYEFFPSLDTDCWVLASGAAAARVPISIVRLRAHVSPADVNNELRVLAARLALQVGESPSDTRFYVSGRAQRQFEIGAVHYALIGAVAVILLVASGNLATLQLARGVTRGPELALRAALGAARRDIVATLVLENAILAAAGMALGVVMTLWGIHLIRATIPVESAGYLVAPRVSWRIFAVASGTTIVSLMLVGVLPALFISRVDPNTLLKSRTGTGMHRRHRRRYALLIALQIGLGVPLLSCGALLLRSAMRLDDGAFMAHQRMGFDPHPIVSATMTVRAQAGTAVALRDAAIAIVDRVHGVSGVSAAAASADATPLHRTITIENIDGTRQEKPVPMWTYTLVSPSYFRTLGRAMAAGTDFAEGVYDAPVVVLEAGMARFLWPGLNPVGRVIKFGDERSSAKWARVIGVVADQRDTLAIHVSDPYFGMHPSGAYRVFSAQDTVVARGNGVTMQLFARAPRDVDRVAVGVRHALWNAADVASPYVVTLDERLGTRRMRAQSHFMAMLFSIFSAVALGLAAVGVYGIVSHSVNERRREFGVRVSLGATPRHILVDVLGDGQALALTGVALGLLLTRRSVGWLEMFMTASNDLYDARLFAVVALVLGLTALVAALVPAWSATKVQPVEALRND